MFKKITEATVTISVPVEKKISAKLPVFYNPIMQFNRDSSILLLNAIDNKDMQLCDLLAGSGIRSIRFLAELDKDKIKSIAINDYKEDGKETIRGNLELNKEQVKDSSAEIIITNQEASSFLLSSKGFDYIDIDPFGTPNKFLDTASRRISRGGILAVTATDTSALAGTYPKSCRRKYWAEPSRGPMMHELGLRILIRKCQLVAAQYEKAIVPIYSYAKDHYMRVYFRCGKSKSEVDEVLRQHGMLSDAGPLWLGELWDKDIADKMYKLAAGLEYKTNARFLQTIRDESRINTVGYHDIHHICRQNSLECPSFDAVMDKVKEKGHPVTRTHFSPFGLRSSISGKELLEIIKQVLNR